MWPPKISAERISLANLSPPAPSKIRGPQTVAGACGQGKEAQEKKNQLARRLVKDAKAAGCPAFKGGGRVRRDELLAWLEKHPARKSRGRVQLPRSRKPIGCSGYGASQPKGEMRSVFVP